MVLNFKKRLALLLLFSLALACTLYFFYQPLKTWLKSSIGTQNGWDVIRTGNGRVNRIALTSPKFLVDTLYPSMTGPAATHYFNLEHSFGAKINWLLGYSTYVISSEGNILSDDFLCHNNLDYNAAAYYHHWGLKGRAESLVPRLATLTQGQTAIQFPKGYGIPLKSTQVLSATTQVLNVTDKKINQEIYHKIELDYTSNKNLNPHLKPLFQQSVMVLVEVDTNKLAEKIRQPDVDCLPVLTTINALNVCRSGEVFTGHWVLPEGKDTIVRDVTNLLNLPFSTSLHYASVHVHPHCVSLELIDRSTGKSIFKSRINNDSKQSRMYHIEAFSSEEGIKLFQDHSYELVCITDHQLKEKRDMMAVMLLYLRDYELEEKLSEQYN
ncbi:MAG: hypothetical protein HOH13_02550 [Crocinitomicaceae bacterium]|jgi:hypothetical protein|nr:hypothetical protein [Crocinitomicaceae bacterium]MBT6514352.1 hypothetical protein [Crocinitomicaceae bacterium]